MPDLIGLPFIQRLLAVIGLIAGGILLFRLFNRVILARANSLPKMFYWNALRKPVLLYFTTPTCAPCLTVQRPAIQQLQELVGDQLEVVEIDASSQRELANRWGVLSVPTTFILDANGAPRHVNHGVTSTETLLAQLRDSTLASFRSDIPPEAEKSTDHFLMRPSR